MEKWSLCSQTQQAGPAVARAEAAGIAAAGVHADAPDWAILVHAGATEAMAAWAASWIAAVV